jgi:hypothetical protein
MFANTQMGGMNMAFPDVCNTPTPAGPVPVPYPNITTGVTAIPNVPNILVGGMPVHNLGTTTPFSNGDNAGVGTGVASGMVMGPSRNLLGSFTTLMGGMPVTRMTSMSMQNGTNAVGATLAPSQFKVMVLAP